MPSSRACCPRATCPTGRETPLVVADISDAEEAELVLAVDEVGVLVHDVAPPVLEGGLLHLEDNAIERAHLKCYGTHNLGLRLALHQGQQHRPWVLGNSNQYSSTHRTVEV
jgi:hypothetical protein